MSTIDVVCGVVLALALGSGLYLLIRNPPMPPPSPEMVELNEKVNELGRALGEALLPPFERIVALLSKLMPIVELPVFDFLRPDPNPFPRFHLFRSPR